MKDKLLKKIIFICLIVILVELLAMFIIKIVRERNIDHVNTINDLVKLDDGYIVVGISDFNDSKNIDMKTYEYENSKMITNQARIAKLDKDYNLVWENTFDNKFDASFYSVIKVDDGLIAVGSLVSKYEQIEVNTRDALIVKYDLTGKMIWYKTYHVLSDTEFYKVIDDGNGNVVVIGQSIYENMEMGNHITGGGIIVRYDKDGNLLANNNYGGNKSGSFNDIIKVKDGYIVCGKDGANYGIVVKFKKDFNRDPKDTNLITKKLLWQRTYSNTDDIGFSSMVIKDNIIYLVGAINVSNEKDENGNTKYQYDAGIVLFNTSGKYLDKYPLEEEVYHRFNSVILEDNDLVLTGLMDVNNIYKGNKVESMAIKFNLKDKKYTNQTIYLDKSDYIINKIIKLDKTIIIGTSKSKCSLYGCEYEPLIFDYK
jgi:hypothetical protein